MPTSPDGILEVQFDPSRAAVAITVDGGMWPSAVTEITMWRTPVGHEMVEVRGVVERRVEGGWWIGSDHEMPLDTEVVYTVTGYDSLGAVVATATVTVSTTGAAWGVWLKAPGRGDLTAFAQLRERGGIGSATIGGTYQVHSGPEVPSWSGVAGDRATLELKTTTQAQDAAVRTLLRLSRTLLVQTGQPADIGTGSDWWMVENYSQINPAGFVADGYWMRWHTIALVLTTIPVGEGVVTTGQDYSNLLARYATYQALLDGNATYQDVMSGGS